MKSWQVRSHGEPASALELVEAPVPEPGPGQVRIRVRAAALNFPDVLLCRGTDQIRPELPVTPSSFVQAVGLPSGLVHNY